jgi:hypothetical protein
LVNCNSSFRVFVIGETGQGVGGGRGPAKDIIELSEDMVGAGQVIINKNVN